MIFERDDLKLRTVVLILVAVGLFVCGLIYYRSLIDGYQRWKQGGSIEQVKKFTAEKDVPNALLAIRTALSQEPGNPVVWRLAADFAEELGDPDSIRMRQQVVNLEPGTVSNRLALARTALRFKELLTAREALEGVADADRNSADYRRAAAALAMKNDLPAEAAALLTTIVRREPGDVQARFDRAVLSLRYGSPALVASARGELQALTTVSETRLLALRELTADAQRNRDLPAALSYSAQLTVGGETAFVDLLRQANIRLSMGQETLEAVLPALQKQALSHPDHVAELAGWLSVMNRTAQASEWLKALPAEIREQPSVRLARTNCLVALRDWEAARELIVEGAYGHIQPDVVQLAFSARVLRDNDRPSLGRSSWDEAIRLSSSNLSGLRVLHRLALEWKWGPELNAVLLAIATHHPSQKWAFQALVERHYRARDTAALKSVYLVWHDAEPESAFVEANTLFLELLTETGTIPSQMLQRISRLHAANLGNAFIATSYAFALWKSSRPTEALKVMDKLSDEERHLPARALYMGLFLQAANRRDDAHKYLKLVRSADLLPEERVLFNNLFGAPAPSPRATGKPDKKSK